MKKYYNKLMLFGSGLFLSAMPAFASPQTDESLANAPGVNITIQSLFGIIAGLACWSTRLITIVMVVMIVWYGFKMMASQGNETNFKNARKSLDYAVVGMIVILGAYTIIATVGNTIEGIGAQNLSTRTAKFINYTPLGSCSY